MEQSNGKIFLASERGHTETDWFRSYNTFNFGEYRSEHKTPIGALYVLNDDTLAGSKRFQLKLEERSLILVIPVVGAVQFGHRADDLNLVGAGQCQTYVAESGTEIFFENPFEEELINFIQIWIKITDNFSFASQSISFTLDERKNSLVPIVSSGVSVEGFLGKYDGRNEDKFCVKDKKSHVFAFIIQGAFEVQNRLLEARDGLALWGMEDVEFEALSNEAIILILKLSVSLTEK